jgi:hypothetical protein
MKTRIGWLLLLVVTAFFGLAGWNGYGQKIHTKSIWEYQVASGLDEKALNERGAQGWELVAIDPNRTDNFSGAVTYYFKRAK